MKPIILALLVTLSAASSFAQVSADSGYAYPTKLENLLHRTGAVISTSSLEVGTVEGKMFQAETNSLTVLVRTEVISTADNKAKEYGVALQMGLASREWRSRIIYVDYDELDGLVAGMNKVMALQPELPVVQARYETKGGLISLAYSTQKREVLGRLEFRNDDTSRIRVSLDTLKEFRDFLMAAKANLDTLKNAK